MTRSKGRTIAASSSESDAAATPARTVHLVLQGKGGAGKTFAALMLSQYLAERGGPLVLLDADPVNASLSSLSALPVERVAILTDDNKVDTPALDLLTERFATEDADFVVDSGASSFVPMSEYMLRNQIAELLDEAGRRLVVHTIVTGGSAMLDTIKGLAAVIESFPLTVPVIVWVNEFFGPVINASGLPFEEMPIYTTNTGRIAGLVRLNALREDAAHDLQVMLGKHQTFAQALAPENATILRVQKSRLFKIRQALWPQLEAVL